MGMKDSLFLISLQCIVFFYLFFFVVGFWDLVLQQMHQMICSWCNVRSKDQGFKSISFLLVTEKSKTALLRIKFVENILDWNRGVTQDTCLSVVKLNY